MSNFSVNDPVPESALAAAQRYLKLGFYSIPIPHGEKGPKTPGWQKLRLSEEELQHEFGSAPKNIGLLLGDPSGGQGQRTLTC